MKKRNPKTEVEKQGVIHVRQVTNKYGHIFREVFEEDVGVDAHIELCNPADTPTGIIIGLQIKSGESYIHAETDSSFTFYPDIDDLEYWQSYTLPLYLVVYRPELAISYWVDIKKQLNSGAFEGMLSGLEPKKFIIEKSYVFSKNFFIIIPDTFADMHPETFAYSAFLKSFKTSSKNGLASCIIPPELRMHIDHLQLMTAKRLLEYIESKQHELSDKIRNARSLDDASATEYVWYVIFKLRTHIFMKENTGFVLIAFEDKRIRDDVARIIETFINCNRYLVLKGERTFADLAMNSVILVAIDDWDKGQDGFEKLFDTIKTRFGLQWAYTYEGDFYHPEGASIFFTPDYYMQYAFEELYDTGDELVLFDYCRRIIGIRQTDREGEYLWFSIGKDRVKIYAEWDPALYSYFYIMRTIRTGGEWSHLYDFTLELEFGITDKVSMDEFIEQAKAAKRLGELPLMTESMMRDIQEGMAWGEKHYGGAEY